MQFDPQFQIFGILTEMSAKLDRIEARQSQSEAKAQKKLTLMELISTEKTFAVRLT